MRLFQRQTASSPNEAEVIHQVIPATKGHRWLEIEEMEGDPAEIQAYLDEICEMSCCSRAGEEACRCLKPRPPARETEQFRQNLK